MPTATLLPELEGTLLADRYEIEREIGRGGFAVVYVARDLELHRLVAVKVLNPAVETDENRQRFQQEIDALRTLDHPNVMPLLDCGEADAPFYVMPFVDGETLRARLEREGQLPMEEAAQIAIDIARALQHAHDAGIVHRDIKPENILLDGDRVIVADFGIAFTPDAGAVRLTEAGSSPGTPLYMAPEQIAEDVPLDGRADIYSLAAVLYEMLAGVPPHVGGSLHSVIARVLTRPVRPVTEHRPDAPAAFIPLLGRALEKDPADRFGTMRELAGALHGLAFQA